MSNKLYHDCSENSNTSEDAAALASQADPSKDSVSNRAEERQESDSAATRHIQHHLPWDRLTKRITLRRRPSIIANIPDLRELASQVWTELRKLNDPPFLFRHENKLCRIEADDSGAPVPVSMDAQRMNYTLVRLIDWVKEKDGEVVNVRPPKDLASHLVADPDPPVPILRRNVTAPIFTAEGRLLQKPGDYADGILYLPPKSFRLPALPDNPSVEDIRSAVEFVNKDLLADFPFVGQPERANCFAGLITPFVRELIVGPTPLFWVDKSTGGSGGTLLSNVIAAPLLGAPPSGVTAPRDEAEWNRVILSTLLRSPNAFFIDNCNDYLSSEALASAITAAKYEGRIIGSSKNEAAEVRCLWIINGNNLHFGWELTRRVVRIRLDLGVSSPDQVDSRKFVHKNLLSWVFKHRAEVIHSLLVMVKAWQAAGCPGPADGTPEFGSFESWREVVGGILNTAEVPGFLCNLSEAREDADQESAIIRSFIEAWRGEIGIEPVCTTELLPIARRLFDLAERDHSAAIQLGMILSKHENQFHGAWRIQRLAPSKGKTQWQLVAQEV
jgi:putative DNA primase/helicase